MKILVVEDSDQNYDTICRFIVEYYPNFSFHFIRCACLLSYVRKINVERYDLIIFDIIIPRREGEEGFDLSLELISESAGTINSQTRAIALTSMDSPEYETLLRFNERMIPVLLRNDQASAGKICKAVGDLSAASKVDFLIICALEKEADGFQSCGVVLGAWEIGIGASRRRSVAISGLKGYIYVLPRAGLTNAALITAKAVEYYLPRVVAMSGICAGVPGECDFTDILVAEMSWDYQVGKFTEDGFESEPYQEFIDVNFLNEIKHYCATSDIADRLASFTQSGTKGLHASTIKFGSIASGSAVVADKLKAEAIGLQQRKFLGIEMEIAAVYSACRYSSKPPVYFAAKSVVDFADRNKSDVAHKWGARVSAFFVTAIISQLAG